jgi:hypothetical protein
MAFVTGRAQHPAWKVFKTILFVLVILAAAGAYFYLHPEKWNKWVKGTPLAPAPKVTQMYKWRDTNGQWQISDRPPDDGSKYEVMKFHSDTNIVPSLPVEEK